MRRATVLRFLAGVLVLALASTACEETAGDSYDYSRPSPPRPVAGGVTLIGAAGGLRLLEVADPTGPPGCDGAPAPDLRIVGPGGVVVADPHQKLSAGDNTVLVRRVDGVDRLAVVSSCRGDVERIWLATATPAGLTEGSVVPEGATQPLRITGWSRDGNRLLGVEAIGAGLAGQRVVSVDAATGAVAGLGRDGYWVDELATGGLVVDEGDRVRVGDATVTFEDGDGTGARGRLAVAPDGSRVAIGTSGSLIVASPDGRAPRWATEPVMNVPAWSTDGSAVAYVSVGPSAPGGDGAAPGGPLRVATATAAPVTVAPAAWAAPTAFAGGGADLALVYNAADTSGVGEVTFPRWSAPLPSTSAAYTRAAVEAWVTGDTTTLARLSSPEVFARLRAVPVADPSEVVPEPECQVVLNQSYCLTAVAGHELTMRVDDKLVAERAEHAVLDAFFDTPGIETPTS
jgi:hypothetical protein